MSWHVVPFRVLFFPHREKEKILSRFCLFLTKIWKKLDLNQHCKTSLCAGIAVLFLLFPAEANLQCGKFVRPGRRGVIREGRAAQGAGEGRGPSSGTGPLPEPQGKGGGPYRGRNLPTTEIQKRPGEFPFVRSNQGQKDLRIISENPLI